MLFDTHTHINTMKYNGGIEKFVADAQANGIKKMICVGYDIKTSLEAIDLAYRFPGVVYASVGIHPTETNNITDSDLAQLDTMLNEPCVVALGEIGLDYHWDTVKPDIQKDIFIKQLTIARKNDKPVIIHCREAIKDTYDILKNNDVANIGGIMHSYAGSSEMACEFIKLNLLISISGVITFKNNKKTPEVVRAIDLENLLLETDCPYLTPEPFRGKTNYPWYTLYVAQKIAEEKNLTVDEVTKKTYENACKLFRI